MDNLKHFKKVLGEVYEVCSNLERAFEKLDCDEMNVVSGKYPFGRDFQEIPSAVLEWEEDILEYMEKNSGETNKEELP